MKREKFISIIKKKCTENKNFVDIKRKFINDNTKIDKEFKIFNYRHKLVIAEMNRKQKLDKLNKVLSDKNIRKEKILCDHKQKQEKLKSTQINWSYQKENLNLSDDIDRKIKVVDLKNYLTNINENRILTDKINKLHIKNTNDHIDNKSITLEKEVVPKYNKNKNN